MKEEKQRQFMALVDQENESTMVKTKELQEEHAKMLKEEVAKLTECVEQEKQEKLALLRHECEQHLEKIKGEEEKTTQTRLQELKERSNKLIEEESSKMLDQEKQDALALIRKNIELEVEAIKDQERISMDAEVAKLREEHAKLIEEERIQLAKMLDQEKEQKVGALRKEYELDFEKLQKEEKATMETKLKELHEENAKLLETSSDLAAQKEKVQNSMEKELEEFKAQVGAKIDSQKAELSLETQQVLDDARKLHEVECAQELSLKKEQLTKELEKDLADFELQLATGREGKKSKLEANHEEEIRTLTASFSSKLMDARQTAHAKFEEEQISYTTKDGTADVTPKALEDFKVKLHEEHQRKISDLVKDHAEKETKIRQEMAQCELKHVQMERDIAERELKQIQVEKEVIEKEAQLQEKENQLNTAMQDKQARLDTEYTEKEKLLNEKWRRKEEELSQRCTHPETKEKSSIDGVSQSATMELLVVHTKQELQFQRHEMEARHEMEIEELVTRSGHCECNWQERLASLDAMWLNKMKDLEQKHVHALNALEEGHKSNLKRTETQYADKLDSKEKEVSSLEAEVLHIKKEKEMLQTNQIRDMPLVASIDVDVKHDEQALALQTAQEDALSQLKNKYEQGLETEREALLTKLAKARSQLEMEQCDLSRRQEQQKAERERKELQFATQMEQVEAKFAALIHEREQGLIQKLKNVKIEMEAQVPYQRLPHRAFMVMCHLSIFCCPRYL